MVKERLNRPNHVYGPHELKNGRLTFRTTDAAMVQRLERDHTSRGITARYANPDDKAVRAAADRVSAVLAAYLDGKPPWARS
jgi:hypothetical protein